MENNLEGTLKWESRIKRRQRKWLQAYYMITIIYQRYSMFQGISLIWIFTDKLLITLKILFMIIYSLISYWYIIPKMYHLLDYMNYELKATYFQLSMQFDNLDQEQDKHNKKPKTYNMFSRQISKLSKQISEADKSFERADAINDDVPDRATGNFAADQNWGKKAIFVEDTEPGEKQVDSQVGW